MGPLTHEGRAIMKTKHFKVRESAVENGVVVRAGNNTFSFEGMVEEPNGEKVQYTFTVEGVEDRFDAVNVVDSYYCGYFDRLSARNIRKEAN
jgi:hypothetical protein